MTPAPHSAAGPVRRWQDYSDKELLAAALAELTAVQAELARVSKDYEDLAKRVEAVARTPEEIRSARAEAHRQRIAGARKRRLEGKLGLTAYLRVRLWIAVKGRRADAEAIRKGTFADFRAEPVRSEFLGDKPLGLKATDAGYLRATVWAQALEPMRGQDRKFLELCRRLAVSRGNISEVLAYTYKIDRLQKTKNPKAIRQVEGRLREISGWVPRIPGPRVTIEPAAPGVILHLVKESRPYHSNGFTSRSHNNFLAEADAGLTPVVVTEPGFPRNDGVTDFPSVETVDGIEHHRLDFGADYKPAALDQLLEDFAWLAFRKAIEIRPAVIHASSGRRGYETALVGLALKEKTGLPLVYEVRSFFEGTWTGETAMEEKSEIFARRMAVELMCMQAADHVLTIGEAMKAELIGRGIPEEKISVVPNGVDLAKFDPAADPRDLREAHGIGGFTFGYVSNMDHPRESQETLIDAAHELKARGRDFTCVLVGSGARRDYLEEYARRRGVDDMVVFTGSVDHSLVSNYYAMIDAFVVPRIRERASTYVTPLKPYEAMAMKKPVIGSDLPALREILEPPLRGLVFEPGDVSGLCDRIEELADDPGERERLGVAGWNWLVSNRQWAMNGAVYADVFANVRRAAELQEAGMK
ncbi:hypothetical protein BIU82_00930 [Arthrobacter sp. SW1]|uniref:glycosyltransferase family 4 protein n=1 Tax=Arthrobacter sp. SW1 TaxID=1920889 RepID=UPI000877D48F|nr:glycosyltransferase family 4 protein [Arthrobacter sp. SW1]OFI39659.1 hypothetical protein BIU82_00930 [Arthrobacter sp. SW1]